MEVPHAKRVFRQFIRSPRASALRLESLADLTHWSCTFGELARSSFGPLENVDGLRAIGDVSAFTTTDPDSGRDRTYWGFFDWSLLQSVDPAPDD